MKINENKKKQFPLTKQNYILLIAGFVVVLIGFLLMSGGGSNNPDVFTGEELFSFRRITLAPFVVLLGFVVVLYGIMKKSETDQ